MSFLAANRTGRASARSAIGSISVRVRRRSSNELCPEFNNNFSRSPQYLMASCEVFRYIVRRLRPELIVYGRNPEHLSRPLPCCAGCSDRHGIALELQR